MLKQRLKRHINIGGGSRKNITNAYLGAEESSDDSEEEEEQMVMVHIRDIQVQVFIMSIMEIMNINHNPQCKLNITKNYKMLRRN